MSSKMTDQEARKVFDKAIAAEKDPSKRDDLRLVREFLTNPTFRKAMEDEVAKINGL